MFLKPGDRITETPRVRGGIQGAVGDERPGVVAVNGQGAPAAEQNTYELVNNERQLSEGCWLLLSPLLATSMSFSWSFGYQA